MKTSNDALQSIQEQPQRAGFENQQPRFERNKKLSLWIGFVSLTLFIILAVYGNGAAKFLTTLLCVNQHFFVIGTESCISNLQNPFEFIVEAFKQICEFSGVVVVSHLINERTIKTEELQIYDNRLEEISSQFERRLESAGKNINRKIIDSVTSIRTDVASDLKLSGYGLVQIHNEFGVDTIIRLIKDLEKGSTFFWHTTYIQDFIKMAGGNGILLEKAREGVHFRFLILEPFCSNSGWRAKEVISRENVSKEYLRKEVSRYNTGIRSFQSSLQELVDYLLEEPECKGSIKYRLYRCSPGIPFILIESPSGSLDKCFTGYFLNLPPNNLYYLEWEGSQLLKPRHSGIPQELKRFWNNKWINLSRDIDEINPFRGKWFYLIYNHVDLNQQQVLLAGEATISEDEQNGDLSVRGFRTFQKNESNSSGDTYIAWDSERVKINIDSFDNSLINITIRYHLILRDSNPRDKEPKGDLDLIYSCSDKQMRGSFNIWGKLPRLNHPDVPLRSGSILFVRDEKTYLNSLNHQSKNN